MEFDTPIDGLSKVLQIEPVSFNQSIVINRSCRLRITLPTPAKRIMVTAFAPEGIMAFVSEKDVGEQGPVMGGTLDAPLVSVSGDKLVLIELVSRNVMRIARICYIVGPSKTDLNHLEEIKDYIQPLMQRWSEAGNILEPHTHYRLTKGFKSL